MTPAERKALDAFVVAVRQHYGARVVDILIFGSRARGDARPDSDADVAVILEDGDWHFWGRRCVSRASPTIFCSNTTSTFSRGRFRAPRGIRRQIIQDND